MHEIDSEQAFDKAFQDLSKLVEPVVVHVRVGGSSNELRSEIVTKLVQEEGYIELDKEKLQAVEIQRQTELGKEISRSAKHKITAEQNIRMLRKFIYPGNKRAQKYVLTMFPETTDEALEFEKGCAHFSAIIYASQDDPMVEIAS